MPLLKEEVLKNCILIILSSCFFWRGESSRTTPNAFAMALINTTAKIDNTAMILKTIFLGLNHDLELDNDSSKSELTELNPVSKTVLLCNISRQPHKYRTAGF